MNSFFLTGRLTEPNIEPIVFDQNFGCFLHTDIIAPLLALQTKAREQQQDLQVASGYRNFSRQLTIWNEKVSGKRTIFDRQGRPVDTQSLSEWEIVQAILHWSALPGASRHHWGTDVDVFNPELLPKNYTLQLSQEEYQSGVLSTFNQCLNELIIGDSCLFFRPYVDDEEQVEAGVNVEGVAAEPWHLSYRPLAEKFQQSLTVDVLWEALSGEDILLKSCVLEHLDEIYQRFVVVR